MLVRGTGRLSAARASTTKGKANALPATPVCSPPLINTSFVATGTAVSFELPVTPSGVLAVIVVVPRLPSAFTLAVALAVPMTVATVASLEVQLTSKFAVAAPEESTAVAVYARVGLPTTVVSDGLTVTVLVDLPGPL